MREINKLPDVEVYVRCEELRTAKPVTASFEWIYDSMDHIGAMVPGIHSFRGTIFGIHTTPGVKIIVEGVGQFLVSANSAMGIEVESTGVIDMNFWRAVPADEPIEVTA